MIRAGLLGAALALALIVAGVVIANLAVAAESKADKPKASAAPYVHVVLFTVKKDAPGGEVQALVTDAHELLAKIPTVRSLRVGRPSEKSSGKFIKTDYQVALAITFDDYDGMKTYLDHKLHLEYVERHIKHLDTDKLTVYDFENQKK